MIEDDVRMLYEATPAAAAHHGQQNLRRNLAVLAVVQIEFRHQQQEGFSAVLDIVGELAHVGSAINVLRFNEPETWVNNV
jgi:hypothetical protein